MLKSETYRVMRVKRALWTPFFKDLEVGDLIRFEISLSEISSTSYITIVNLTKRKKIKRLSHTVNTAFNNYIIKKAEYEGNKRKKNKDEEEG